MTTRPAIHPGKHLAEQLEALGMSAAALARKLRVPTNRITHILKVSELLPEIRRCVWDTFSVLARNSG
jgi:plasmid maintenance system antidote protein VapI